MKNNRYCAGFTIVELMVVVIVLGILVAIAAPGFAESIDRTRIKSQVARVVDVIEFGKSEALKHNTWGSTVRIDVVSGSAWAVKAEIIDSSGTTLETRTTDPSDVRGVTLVSPLADQSIAINFRGILSGYVGGTSFITLQSPRGLQLKILVNPIGNISVCAVGAVFGEYPLCAA